MAYGGMAIIIANNIKHDELSDNKKGSSAIITLNQNIRQYRVP